MSKQGSITTANYIDYDKALNKGLSLMEQKVDCFYFNYSKMYFTSHVAYVSVVYVVKSSTCLPTKINGRSKFHATNYIRVFYGC